MFFVFTGEHFLTWRASWQGRGNGRLGLLDARYPCDQNIVRFGCLAALGGLRKVRYRLKCLAKSCPTTELSRNMATLWFFGTNTHKSNNRLANWKSDAICVSGLPLKPAVWYKHFTSTARPTDFVCKIMCWLQNRYALTCCVVRPSSDVGDSCRTVRNIVAFILRWWAIII